MTKDEVLVKLRAEIEEEAEAIAESETQAAISVRVPASLSAALKEKAESEHISTSVLVRRILTEAMQQHPSASALTAEQIEQVEEIARRVYRESA